MAYIKGGSVVDGNLYIEGGLVVRNISTSAGGKLPTLDDGDTHSDRLVKFKNYNGGLQYSSFGETVSSVKVGEEDKKKVNLYAGETKEEFYTLGLSFGSTKTDDGNTKVFTITNDNTIGIDIKTPASKIVVIEKNILDDKKNPIDIKDFDVTTSYIPESFSYSEN